MVETEVSILARHRLHYRIPDLAPLQRKRFGRESDEEDLHVTQHFRTIEQDGRTDAPGYHAFLLRLWCDGDEAGWHASLQAPGHTERRGFADLAALTAYLHQLCHSNNAPLPPPGNR